MEKEQKRSPLKQKPLPLPGGHLRDEWDKILNEQLFPVLTMAAVAVALAILEWAYFLLNLPRHPWLMTIIAIAICFGAYFYFQKQKKGLFNYWLGYQGEIVVGQFLEGLREKGFVPIHDVPCQENGKLFNIDHILIGPQGIFAVETKTCRKTVGHDDHIGYANGGLRVGTSPRGTKSIKQAQKNAKWVEDMLLGRMGEKISVRPLLLFPGWFVEQAATDTVKKDFDVLMLNPKALDGYITSYPKSLNQDQIQHLVAVISAYVHEKASQQIG